MCSDDPTYIVFLFFLSSSLIYVCTINRVHCYKQVNNGITGKYISEKIANCAALFWIQNIDVLRRKDQLEIGCLQYFYLLEQHPEVKRFFTKEKIEETALRYKFYIIII